MDRRIQGFHQDDEHHWVAELECGHTQHVRHHPPWQNRPWVLAEESRREHLGSILPCPLCDRQPASPSVESEGVSLPGLDPYTDARLRGLCHDGAAEAARPARLDKPDRRS